MGCPGSKYFMENVTKNVCTRQVQIGNEFRLFTLGFFREIVL